MGVAGHKALHRYYRLLADDGQSPPGLESFSPQQLIKHYDQAIDSTEREMWRGRVEDWLDLYQLLQREKEALLLAAAQETRHHITVVIPVADRPLHLQACLHSILQLCRAFHYGGRSGNRYTGVSVMVADDSAEPHNMQQHRQLAREFTGQGLDTSYFGLEEQLRQIDKLSGPESAVLRNILGHMDRQAFYHKGPSVMRNIAYLKLKEQQLPRQLFFFIDSDQEFLVKVQTAQGERDLCAINYFAELDRVFSQQNVSLLTGKVVGDPPVSPAVMAGNFLEDVSAFLHALSASTGDSECSFHTTSQTERGEAAYHDMAGLFGFQATQKPYPYSCDLTGEHDHAQCLLRFAGKLNQFFYGEHPTRKSYYSYAGKGLDLKPARTVYTGNYVFNEAGLNYFIPFAPLRLRMAGPTLGRLIKADMGLQFVSANLPMLHKRTVEQTGRSEFRPGVSQQAHEVDLSDEFERQYFGDVMLFAMQWLTEVGYPESLLDRQGVEATVESTERQINRQYMAKHAEIMHKLELLKTQVEAPGQWWNCTPGLAEARQAIAFFIRNIECNFSSSSRAHRLVNDPHNRSRKLAAIKQAIHEYPGDRAAWDDILSSREPGSIK